MDTPIINERKENRTWTWQNKTVCEKPTFPKIAQ